jgi:excisionase family DNA binding protein
MTGALLTLGEAAEHVNCSTKTLRRAIGANRLPRRMVGNELRLSMDDLERWTNGAPIESSGSGSLLVPNTSIAKSCRGASPAVEGDPTTERNLFAVTTRKAHEALGIVKTPHGEVIVRKVFYKPKNFFILHLDGSHLALRWMLPSWNPRAPSVRTQITPPTPMREELELLLYYEGLVKTWSQRLRHDGGAPKSGTPAEGEFPYHTLGQIRALMTEELSATLRPMTRYTYNQQWDAVFRYIPAETQLLSIDRTMLQGVVTKLSAEGLKPGTIKTTMRTLGRLLIRAVEDGVIRRNPLNQVTLPKVIRPTPVYLNGVQIEKLMATARADSVAATLFFALGIYLGLRKNEIVNLRWENLDLVNGVAQVINTVKFTTKSGRNRTVPICEDMAELLHSHKRVAGYVVNDRIQGYMGKRYRHNPGRMFDRVSTQAGLDDILTPHVLRHTFASLAAQAGVSLYKIGSWMGHTMSEVTEIYAHLAQYDADIERLNFGENKPDAEETIRGKRLGQK